MNERTMAIMIDVLSGFPQEEVTKLASAKSEAAKSGLSRAAKWVAGATGVGAAGAGVYTVGKGQGRKQQRAEDVESFKGQAKNIFNAGRVLQRRSDVDQFRTYLKNNTPGLAPKQNHSPRNSQTHYKMAEAVVDGWCRGSIATSKLVNLPSQDLEKVAAVTLDRMNRGDMVAELLWRALNAAA